MNIIIESPQLTLHTKHQIEKLHPSFQFAPFLEQLDDYLYYTQKFKTSNTSISTVQKHLLEWIQFFYTNHNINQKLYTESIEASTIQCAQKEIPLVLIHLQHPHHSKDNFISSKQLNRPIFHDAVLAFLHEKLLFKNNTLQSIVLTDFKNGIFLMLRSLSMLFWVKKI